MAAEQHNSTEVGRFPQLVGLSITGDSLPRLSFDQARHFIESLRDSSPFLADLVITPVWDDDHAATAQTAAETPVSRQDFVSFAKDQELPEQRGSVSWLMASWTVPPLDRRPWEPVDAYPSVRRLSRERKGQAETLDLWSLYHRLRASRLDPSAWRKGTQMKTEFLAQLVNGVLHPDEPLPVTRRAAVEALPNTAELLTEQLRKEQRAHSRAE